MYCQRIVQPSALFKIVFRCTYKHFQNQRLLASHHPETEPTGRKVKGTVFVSSDNNIFTNLALEDWFYRRWNFSSEHVLLLWRNEPCVVIGRHQNPWVECNSRFLAARNISLARRNSGGGTVYHDMGNLNCTFFTDRKCYNRKGNLQSICRALQRNWNVNAAVTTREDIMLDGQFKISGTAAKLARNTAYHHCTILFSADKEALIKSLTKCSIGLESKATESVPSTVINLQDVAPEVDYWPLIRAISREFFIEHQGTGRWNIIDPTEESCPGISELRKHLCSWDWIYGHTPRFTVKKHFPLPLHGLSKSNMPVTSSEGPGQVEFCRELSTLSATADQLTLNVQVYRAKIEHIDITPETYLPNIIASELMNGLKDKWFKTEDIVYEVDKIVNAVVDIHECEHRRLLYVGDCLKDLIASV